MKTEIDFEQLLQPARWYAYCVDRREFSMLPDIFAPEATLVVASVDPSAPPILHLQGFRQISDALHAIDIYPRTFHMLGQQLVLDYRVDTATTETYCRASHFYTRNDAQHEYVMYIRYRDELLRKPDGGWQFGSRHLHLDAELGIPLIPRR